MKQYKTLQSLPGLPTGTVFASNSVGDVYRDSQAVYMISPSVVENSPEWFVAVEPINNIMQAEIDGDILPVTKVDALEKIVTVIDSTGQEKTYPLSNVQLKLVM